jgi:lipid II:glycine glycyltransferase (peptidoglycan interpeptide bridge formation enzyme)
MEASRAIDNLTEFDDIFFDRRYAELYADDVNRPGQFVYRDGCDEFVLSYIKKPIPGTRFYDFETAYGYSGPVSNTLDREFIKAACKSLYKHCENEMMVAGFIRFNPIIENHKFVDPQIVDVIKEKKVVVLDLDNVTKEQVRSKYRDDNKNKIRRAVKSNIKVITESGISSIDAFKGIYYRTMDRANADRFYYFSDTFFLKFDPLLNGNYNVLLAYAGSELVGGAIILFKGKILTYFLSATTDFGRECGAANALRDYAVEFAFDKGIKVINYGGGRTRQNDDSLLKFKLGFTDRTADYFIGKLLINRNEYDKICENWARSVNELVIKRVGNMLLKYRYS